MKSILLLLLLAFSLQADECSHLWKYELKINPSEPKGFVGDSWAAYSLMGYKNTPNLAWHFVSQFPRARFMSIQTYTTLKKQPYDVLFDYQFEAATGSESPFQEGASLNNANRNFEVDLIPLEGTSTMTNVIHKSPTEEIQSVYFRIYVPENGVTISEKDFPKVYAYNFKTGEPMSCPEFVNTSYAPDDSQAKVAWVPAKKSFKFRSVKESIFKEMNNQGHNAAIPDYLFAMNRIKKGNVAVVSFKAPRFSEDGSEGSQAETEVRYWSICTQNVVKGETLNCLADFNAKLNKEGQVTLVVGPLSVKTYSEKMGYSFLEDKRGNDQKVMQFLYRNLLPVEDFEKDKMYQNEYKPTGKVCSQKVFLSGGCL